MKHFRISRQRGLTLTELLVVMLIIGLLSSMAVPVYVSRMEDARIRVAMGECREIAQAEEQCSLIHGYYVPFQVLDDRAFVQGEPNNQGDIITLESWSQIFLINPLIGPSEQIANQYTLGNNLPRITAMRETWAGPFITYHRVYTGYDDPNLPQFVTNPVIRLDFPLDPWGEAYRFYSPLGIVGTSALQTTEPPLNTDFSNGYLTNNDDRNLERYAVISFGRDGLPQTQSGLNNEDDITYLFGTPGVDSQFGLRQ